MLLGDRAAIYDKLAAGNEGRVLAREVQAATSDFRGLAEPAERVAETAHGVHRERTCPSIIRRLGRGAATDSRVLAGGATRGPTFSCLHRNTDASRLQVVEENHLSGHQHDTGVGREDRRCRDRVGSART